MSKNVFAWGSNKYGELGLSLSAETKIVGDPLQIRSFDGNPVSASSGEGHSLILMDTGDVYAFGRGKEGQLGFGVTRSNQMSPQIITELQHEYVTNVVCGAVTSYAVTASGSVYQWGLIQRNLDTSDIAETSAAAGELTGMAEDQSRTVVVDVESRQYSTQVNLRPGASRQLRDIVSESTERWLLANDEADREYLAELRAMGYHNEELEQKEQDRGTEYHGMLRVGCYRVLQLVPQRIAKIANLRVVSIAAGYAHSMLITSDGRLYASGYNDRGQLGIGHRISTADFMPVQKLDSKFVVQVVCGQQHNLCRCVDRSMATELGIHVGSAVGADVYAWGNGILGQLGMGRRGTSKGRLQPTLCTDLCRSFPLGIMDIGAGSNFSVALTIAGEVWSWGHAEYNQHGTGGVSTTDYTDPYYYFTPREVDISLQGDDQIIRISCGSNFTIGVTTSGEAYSWGWGAYGTLGRGARHVSSVPESIPTLGLRRSEHQVLAVTTGTNHALAIVAAPNSHWAAANSALLDSTLLVDAQIEIDGSDDVFYCHRIVLSARCRYLRGYLRTSASEGADTVEKALPCGDGDGDEGGDETVRRVLTRVYISSAAANPVTVRCLLEYLYTDTFTVPRQKAKQLEDLATDLSLSRLATLARRQRRLGMFGEGGAGPQALPPSTFVADLATAVGSEEYADVVFQANIALPSNSCDESCGDSAGEVIEGFPCGSQQRVTYGHKCLLTRIGYFHSLFSSKFKENCLDSSDGNGKMVLCLDGFAADGIDFQSFKNVLYYAYTGSVASPGDCVSTEEEEEEDGVDYMSMLVAGNRLGLPSLTKKCEHLLCSHLTDFPENIDNCAEFAKAYDLSRLETLCQHLRRQGLETSLY